MDLAEAIQETGYCSQVVKFNSRNSVWLVDISKFVDCSHIRASIDNHTREETQSTDWSTKMVFLQRQSSADNNNNNNMLIYLRENHVEDNICQVDNLCSLAHVLNHYGTLSNIVKQHTVKKKRTGGRKRGQISIFHGFYRLFLLIRKTRSGGRRRRTYVNQAERLLPHKKRHRGAE